MALISLTPVVTCFFVNKLAIWVWLMIVWVDYLTVPTSLGNTEMVELSMLLGCVISQPVSA